MIYNINELLDKKKYFETSLVEFEKINPQTLLYEKITLVDKKNNTSREEERIKKISLIDYIQKYNLILDELMNIKVAIQSFNAQNVLNMIQEREIIRKKIKHLQNIKDNLPTETGIKRLISLKNHEGEALEITENRSEPMFESEEVTLMIDHLATQERKLNTEIQKINLNAVIELKS